MQPDLRATRGWLTRRYAAFVAGTLLVFALGVYGQVRRSSEDLLRQQAEQLAATAAAELPLMHHEIDEARAMAARQRLDAISDAGEANGWRWPGHRIVWIDDELQALQSSGSFRPDGALRPPASDLVREQWLPIRNGVAFWRPVLAPRGRGGRELQGYVVVAVASASTDAELSRLRHGLLIGGLLASVVAFACSQWMVAVSLEPVRRQIERLIAFTADASHELRQPLTAIRALIGSLRHGEGLAGASPELGQKLAQIDQTSARMGALVDDLLLLTRFDRAIDDRPSMESFPLAELVEDVLDLHQAAAEAAGVRLQARIEAPGRVRGSPDRLRRLVENLLSNALRFSPPGGTVTLGLGQGKGVVRLWVEDEGPGIPLHQRSQVFERFWQADGARSGAEHHGLGLAIARAIAQAHGGQLWAEDGQAKQNGKPTGCQMILELPLQTGSDLPPSLFTSSPRVV